jgi:hypothetical protein
MYTDEFPDCCGIIVHSQLYDPENPWDDWNDRMGSFKDDLPELEDMVKRYKDYTQMIAITTKQSRLFAKTLKSLGFRKVGPSKHNPNTGNRIMIWIRDKTKRKGQ